MLYGNSKQDIAQVIDIFVITPAMDSLGKRIKIRREEIGLDQIELARIAGVSQPTLANLESGKNKRTKFLPELARALRTSVEWLDTGIGNPDSVGVSTNVQKLHVVPIGKTSVKEADEEDPDVFHIRKVKLKLSAGIIGFAIDHSIDDSNPIYFRKGWFADRGYIPEKLIATGVKGQSMESGLYDGDTVVINTADTTPVDGEVYAVNYEGEDVIKRLVRDGGRWWLVSDNADQRRFPRKECTGDMCLLIGRVIHKQSERI